MGVIKDTFAVGGTLIDEVKARGAAVAGPTSLSEYTRMARVCPRVLIEEGLRGLPYISELLHTNCNIFAGYYLTAVSMMADINGVSVLERLERLNPDRDPVRYAVHKYRKTQFGTEDYQDSSLSVESFATGLPTKAKQQRMVALESMAWDDSRGRYVRASVLAASLDAADPKDSSKPDEKDGKKGEGKDSRQIEVGNRARDAIVSVNENNNLGVGKILEVSLTNRGETISIPVTLTLAVGTTDSESLSHILGLWKRDYKFKERWHGMRSGELKFWREFVFMQDIIENQRKALIRDKSGYLSSMMAQSTKNTAAAAISGSASVATASSTIMVSAETARQIELECGFKFDDYGSRQRVFESTFAMLLFVVDTEWEMVKIYHRGIEHPTRLTIKELKSAGKGNGPDIAEILKAYQLGRAPGVV